jgi:hypothetical protein
MKKIFILLASALVSATLAFGQDARGRVPETVVGDVLAAMPCADAATLAQNVQDLVASAPATVELLAARLGEQGTNALTEYALSSIAAYMSDPAHTQYKDAVREGFAKGIAAQADPVNRQFLLAQLRMFATKDDIGLFKQYVNDPLAGPAALATIADLGDRDTILELVQNAAAPKAALADVIADQGYREAEPALLAWAAAATDAVEKNAIAEALGRIGGEASLKWLKANSLSDYMVALKNLPAKKAVKAAKEILKTGNSGLQCAAADVIMENASAKEGLKVLQNLLKSEDRPLRNAAITAATDAYGVGAVAPVLTNAFAKLGEGAKTDVVNWLGARKQGLDLVLTQLAAPGELGESAVRAAGQIGGQSALDALVGLLASSRAPQALEALKSFKGDISGTILQALENPVSGDHLKNLMTIAGVKEIKAAAPIVLNQAAHGSTEALAALSGVVTPEYADAIATTLRNASVSQVPALQKALSAAIHTLTPEEQTAKVQSLMGTYLPARFYPVLAGIGTDEAAGILRGLAAGDSAAKDALLAMDNATVIPDLLASAEEGNEASLKRYIQMLSTYEQDADKKRFGLAEAIGLAKDPALRVLALNKLGGMPFMKSFLLAAKSLDDTNADVRYAAATAVKDIASKCTEEINYDDLKSALGKARALFASTGDADDGYAVDEIDKMLLEAKPSPRSELTAEEKARGFEMLFDGTDLSKWHGDMEGYTVVNGAIYVSANYGATGNLYTNKEYRNFVYRFEFCFLEEGVNNGVGIRTPENVDAAYDGMCELQILDHDAPVYAGWLRDYQVHGSIYGVVPAKRLKHKPLGEWSTEEIIVEGDHIKVTVNGEVITDANVRKVTKGHNVAPDGSGKNPYTIDGHDHPGMFNYKGFISFCGHGAGLKIRNVRILDLGYKK